MRPITNIIIFSFISRYKLLSLLVLLATNKILPVEVLPG